MSLNTLLEAAEFLERREQQLRAAAAGGSSSSSRCQNGVQKKTSQVGAVLITSQEMAPNLLTLAHETVKKQTQAEQQHVVSSTVNQPRRVLNNSFDIINPLVIDESGSEVKRKQPPMVFRSGTREVHNKLEKHRRAHLKECFDLLKKHLPQTQDEKKSSNLSILHAALQCIQELRREELSNEHAMESEARKKISLQQKMASLKKEVQARYADTTIDFSKCLPDSAPEPAAADEAKPEAAAGAAATTAADRIQIPLLPNKTQISIAATTPVGTIKEVAQPVQTTSLSVLPVGYSVPQGLVQQGVVVQKLIVPKGLAELPLVSTHFIAQQQINGKVVPLAQYFKPTVVVVSRPS